MTKPSERTDEDWHQTFLETVGEFTAKWLQVAALIEQDSPIARSHAGGLWHALCCLEGHRIMTHAITARAKNRIENPRPSP